MQGSRGSIQGPRMILHGCRVSHNCSMVSIHGPRVRMQGPGCMIRQGSCRVSLRVSMDEPSISPGKQSGFQSMPAKLKGEPSRLYTVRTGQ
jgi:hypothetical protein